MQMFIAGLILGFGAGFYSVVCRVESERIKRVKAEKRYELEHERRIDDAVSFEDEIAKLRGDVSDYRDEFRRRVEKELGICG